MKSKAALLASTVLAGLLAAGAAQAQSPAAQAVQPALGPTGQTPGAPIVPNAADQAGNRQGANVSAEAPRGNDSLIQEVVVTAEKREQSLQQVPVAVTAFTSQKRDLIGINSVVDQTNYTPGLTYTEGNDRLSLRGVGRLTNSHAADSGTAIYVDGVFTTSTTQAGRSPLFIERSEVLRGPQGTLYGRNAIGGAYNVISRRPTKDFSGEARVQLASFDRQRFDAAVSVPITDWLRTKVGYTKLHQGEGFIYNTATGQSDLNGLRDEEYFEWQVQGEIGKFDFWAYGGYNRWDNSATPGGTTGGSFVPPNSIPGNGTFPSATYCFGGALNCQFRGVPGNPVLTTGDLRTATQDTPFGNQLRDADAYNVHLTYHFDNFDVKYIGGWQRYTYQFQDDTDGTGVQSYQVPLTAAAAARPGNTPLTVFFGNQNTYEEDEEFYSHEINFASTWDKPLQYIVGLYYYHEKFGYPQHVYAPNQPQIATPLSLAGLLQGRVVPAAANPNREYAYTDNFSSVSSKAVFGQIDYKLFEQFKITLGLRYTNDEKKTTEEGRFISFGTNGSPAVNLGTLGSFAVDITSATIGTPTAAQLASQGGRQQGVVQQPTIDPLTGFARRGLRGGSNAATGTAGFEWTPDRRTLLYGKYSRGYKAFGFNTAIASAFSPFPYSRPEFQDALEVGLKKDWTRRIQTNVVGFYSLYYDAQVPLSIQQGTNPAFSIFYNVPRSILQGIELESVFQPTDNLNILLTYAYLDSHVSKACCVSDPVDPTATAPGASPAGASSQGAIDAITGLPTQGQNLKGNDLPFTPRHKIALNLNYTFDMGRFGIVIPSFSYLYRSEQYTSFFNRPYNLVPDSNQIDGRITYRDPKSRFTVIGYMRNILDDDIVSSNSGTRDQLGRVFQSYGLLEPRTYGIEVHARF